MRIRICAALASAIALSIPTDAHASVTIELGGFLLSGSATLFEPLAPGSLLQLIDLGQDGVFNPLTFADGESNWVSGDDRLLLVSFSLASGVPDFDSAAAFDLSIGSDTPGMLSRVFTFETESLPAGTKLGLRWFPGLLAEAFDPHVAPVDGQIYGEFTRQTAALHGGISWGVPGDGSTVSFDALLTSSQGGADPDAAGLASNTVTVVPEPASMVLGLIGGVYLLNRRPRRGPRR